ncbi:MAG: InlB B-repeat-containing protein [Deltaproteobacteria bacterium]|nr:InlB B-repeat-containing protein [Deltaproteobacteria bacterium]
MAKTTLRITARRVLSAALTYGLLGVACGDGDPRGMALSEGNDDALTGNLDPDEYLSRSCFCANCVEDQGSWGPGSAASNLEAVRATGCRYVKGAFAPWVKIATTGTSQSANNENFFTDLEAAAQELGPNVIVEFGLQEIITENFVNSLRLNTQEIDEINRLARQFDPQFVDAQPTLNFDAVERRATRSLYAQNPPNYPENPWGPAGPSNRNGVPTLLTKQGWHYHVLMAIRALNAGARGVVLSQTHLRLGRLEGTPQRHLESFARAIRDYADIRLGAKIVIGVEGIGGYYPTAAPLGLYDYVKYVTDIDIARGTFGGKFAYKQTGTGSPSATDRLMCHGQEFLGRFDDRPRGTNVPDSVGELCLVQADSSRDLRVHYEGPTRYPDFATNNGSGIPIIIELDGCQECKFKDQSKSQAGSIVYFQGPDAEPNAASNTNSVTTCYPRVRGGLTTTMLFLAQPKAIRAAFNTYMARTTKELRKQGIKVYYPPKLQAGQNNYYQVHDNTYGFGDEEIARLRREVRYCPETDAGPSSNFEGSNATLLYNARFCQDLDGVAEAMRIAAGDEPTSYTLSVTKNGAGTVTSQSDGINCGSTCSKNYAAGTSVTLTAQPSAGSTFGGWTGNCSRISGTLCVVEMDQPRSVSATFTATNLPTFPTSLSFAPGNFSHGQNDAVETRNLRLMLESNGKLVLRRKSTGEEISSFGSPRPQACSTSNACKVSFQGDGNLVLSQLVSGSLRPYWNSGTHNKGATAFVIQESAPYLSVVAGSSTLWPVVSPQTFALSVSTSGGGTVTSDPAGINCGSTCSKSYAAGTSVTLTALPAAGSAFGGWTGACAGTETTCTVSMDTATSVTARFDVVIQPTSLSFAPGRFRLEQNESVETRNLSLFMQSDGNLVLYRKSGMVVLWSSRTSGHSPARVSFQGDGNLVLSQVVAGSPRPYWNSGTANQGATAFVIQESAPYLSIVAGPNTLWPIASPQVFTLSVSTSGSGTVTSNPAGINCGSACASTYAASTSVTLTATPNAGSTFAGWSGACSGTGTCTVQMTTAQNVTATFNLPPPSTHQLTVSKTGSGSGTVRSNLAGINCGSACASTYAAGTSVTLTATPNAGSTFAGWSGACSGTGTCTVQMTTAQNVTATFAVPSPATSISFRAGNFTHFQGEHVETQHLSLYMQTDGNLVLYRQSPMTALWWSGTGGRTCNTANPCKVSFQGDGNLVVSQTGTPLWHTSTYGHPNAVFIVRESKPYLSIVDGTQILWESRDP